MTRSLDFLPDQCDIRLRTVVDYWRSLPYTRLGSPLRRDFDLLDLRPALLPYIWMVDVANSPSRFRFRLCGSHLVDALQFDPTGRYYDELFSDLARSPPRSCGRARALICIKPLGFYLCSTAWLRRALREIT